MSRTSALHLLCRVLWLVSCGCDACAALSGWSQLQDKCAENSQHLGSSLIGGDMSMCKFVGACILL